MSNKRASAAGNATNGVDATCVACPRLADFLVQVRQRYPQYYAAPVPSFGEPDPDLLIVGLAPGLHGANATGRPFTGDYAGILLYQTLYDFGFSNQAGAGSIGDGLKLQRARITNAVRCVPPQNKPTPAETHTCNRYLAQELAALRPEAVVLALGSVAHGAVLHALGFKPGAYRFGHGAHHSLPTGRRLVDSYHCSRYNTQTRRLTPAMFRDVFAGLLPLLPGPRR